MMESIVCERCICDGYVNKLHIHSKNLAKCVYCERRIASNTIRKCDNIPLGGKHLYCSRRKKMGKLGGKGDRVWRG
ncbi:unnamed protein product [Acanthoscelides obtectus]|uniref:Uncharacterized protein n=1 Tax=Acanthoscelides obtectus TaxID=200917 RepID=A0A9P0KGN0_ACAOB|nr:unnamed protein product [Acanthoscelides obtectus]CAK1681700.1 hypothetical protein AOBTE_LOCUS33228 [Acanthoscelides obtectus]